MGFVSQMIIKFLEFYEKSNELSNLHAMWDYAKYQIWQFSLTFSKEKAKQKKAKKSVLKV